MSEEEAGFLHARRRRTRRKTGDKNYASTCDDDGIVFSEKGAAKGSRKGKKGKKGEVKKFVDPEAEDSDFGIPGDESSSD